MVLILLALVIAALAGLAVITAAAPRGLLPAAALGCAVLCGVGAALALVVPLGGVVPSVLALTLGPPGTAMHLSLDPLAACFLLLLFVAAVPCAMFSQTLHNASRAWLAVLPASLAALALILLAGDAVTLLLGLLLLGLCGWVARQEPAPAALYLRGAAASAICLTAAFALGFPGLPPWPSGEFAALRAAPPDGWHADALYLLTLSGACVPLMLVQLDIWRHGPASNTATTLVMGYQVAGLYVLTRVLFDLCGPVQPLWWGVPLLVLGAAAAVIGALRAVTASEFDTVIAVGGLQQVGLALVGFGVALGSRAADQPALAVLALSASWLTLVALVVGRTLLLVCAGAVREGAGTRRLDRLGGLIHRMPSTATATLAGLFGVVALPPGLGFAGFWPLFQSLLAAARIGGFGLQLLLIVVVAALALSSAMSVMAAVRLFGVAFLGRPRTPRAAAADEATPMLRRCLFSVAGLIVLLGLLPALALFPAGPALAPLANAGATRPGFMLILAWGTEMPGYAPLAVAALVALVAGGALWQVRRRAVTTERREAAWSGGFAAPPAWLPFGDPSTQYGPASFAEPLRRALGCGSAVRWTGFRTLPAALFEVAARSRPVAGWLAMIVLVFVIWLVVS